MTRSRGTFLLGLVAGGLGGLILLSWGIAMPILGLLALAIGGTAPPRPMGLAGTLMGLGLAWLALFANAGSRCSTDASCSGPDMTPWLIAAVILIAAGVAVAAVALARDWRQPTS
jgi:hypothetical protein